ncbi:unnamed protein product [Phytophthora lilii]|uniref:Unnamed protein product n=1 Tax=Phytophthora lilii TaxID=2077276 RepID=A0A9W6WWS0_9STRA|nr:unnamed protein product [Phytophthora lilii]
MLAYSTSWNYSVFESTRLEAFSKQARVWSYKFDSTSIAWRAFASFLKVPEIPKCLSYTSYRPDTYFSGEVAFKMIDALVESVSRVESASKYARFGPVGLTLRTENKFFDRLHHFILPKWFTSITWRTNQALHYSSKLLKTSGIRTVCFPRGQAQTPRFCQELWTNFRRSCAPRDLEGQSVGLLYAHTMQRVRDVQTRFPNLTVDLTFLEGQEDLQISRGGLSSLGYRELDVSTLIRARNCASNNISSACETFYVSEYRYETGLLLSDVVQWYRLVATLRIVGQSYFLIRGFGLMLSCFFIYGSSHPRRNIPIYSSLRKACHLFIKVPKHCVVYGSPFPVLCYVLAHLLDAPFTYQVLEGRFITKVGIFDMPFRHFFSYVVVQMRNVWVYALIWQAVVFVSTSRWLTRNNRLSNGIIGVPAFLMSSISSITLYAQYRSTSFRSTRILNVTQIPSNVGRSWVTVKYLSSFARRGRGNALLGGVIIDIKFLICCVFAIFTAWAFRVLWLQIQPEEKKHRASFWAVLAPTPVPYSAGILWPTASMCVHWRQDLFCIQIEQQRQHSNMILEKKLCTNRFCLRQNRFDGAVIPFGSSFSSHQTKARRLRRKHHPFTEPRSEEITFRFIQHQMECLHRRSDDVEANVAFINAVVMSKPLDS